MKAYLSKSSEMNQLTKYLYNSSFEKTKSISNTEMDAIHKLEFLFDINAMGRKTLENSHKLFKEFMDMYHTIVFEKINEFGIEHTEGGSYNLNSSEEYMCDNTDNQVLQYVDDIINENKSKSLVICTYMEIRGYEILLRQEVSLTDFNPEDLFKKLH